MGLSSLFGGGAEEVKPTRAEKNLAVSAAKKINDRFENFVPMEDSFISQLTPTQGERTALRGRGVSDVQQATKGGDQNLVRTSGGQAGQGSTVIKRARLADARGGAVGESTAGADASLRARQIGGLTKMAAFGRGLQDQNSVSLRSAATSATSSALSKLDKSVTDRGTLISGIGTFAGSAIGNYDTAQAIRNKGKAEEG